MAECAHETPYDNPDLNGKYKSIVVTKCSHINNFSKHSIDFTATDRKKKPESLRITIEF